jgi:phosphopantothenoylcysteine decarboxylase / phosphopantothenate---cysteine ligase
MAERKKNVVFGVTGGIAAYKAAYLARELVKAGLEVRVIMTEGGRQFITPLTFRTLTTNEVVTDTFQETGGEVLHIWLAQWAELAIIAPATANVIGKLANGIADDFLTTFALATRAPLLICPAMNTMMYQHPAVQENLRKLEQRGCRFMAPGEGALACGTQGTGRMSDVENILEEAVSMLTSRDLENVHFLISAGPTEEYLDPVRCFTNPSSGKMGYALASAARRRGGKVTLVSGPTTLPDPYGVDLVRVTSANQMLDAVKERFPRIDVLIKAAAVSDFRPAGDMKPHKVKKENAESSIRFERNPDILKEMGQIKNDQCVVGFAAETEDLVENAQLKMKSKNLDFIVANDVTRTDAGFAVETNQVKIIDRTGGVQDVPLCSKIEVGERVLDRVSEWLRERGKI